MVVFGRPQMTILRMRSACKGKGKGKAVPLQAHGDAVCLGTALQAGRSRVRFPMVSLALGLTQPLTEMSTRNISRGVTAAGA